MIIIKEVMNRAEELARLYKFETGDEADIGTWQDYILPQAIMEMKGE